MDPANYVQRRKQGFEAPSCFCMMVSSSVQWLCVFASLLPLTLSSTRGKRQLEYDINRSLSCVDHLKKVSSVGSPVRKQEAKMKFRVRMKRSTFVPSSTSNDINSLLKYLNNGKKVSVKRESDRRKVVKCLKQPGGVVCFSNGVFHRFDGYLSDLTESEVSQLVNGPDGNVEPDKGSEFGRTNGKSISDNLRKNVLHKWRKRSSDLKMRSAADRAKSYQEVLMESHGLSYGPRTCYGFVAPEVVIKGVHRGKSPLGFRSPCKVRSTKKADGSTSRIRGRRKMKHLLRKRSQMLTVACRPLYIPTAKPSINEGRVAKCRLPCGVHNCVPVPTCPCIPPSKTPAPPRITCPPEPEIGCSQSTSSCSRCPKYELTDEPCPNYSSHPKCPYLTTPHCSTSNGSCINQSPSCNRGTAPLKPDDNAMLGTRAVPPSEDTTQGIFDAMIQLGTPANKAASSSQNESRGTESSNSGTKMTGLWPAFDLRKLLKSVNHQNLGKVEPVPP